jgi:hypothetical protein
MHLGAISTRQREDDVTAIATVTGMMGARATIDLTLVEKASGKDATNSLREGKRKLTGNSHPRRGQFAESPATRNGRRRGTGQ